ncbi:MAG: PEP-CTERM sorting domain-containing protein [Phycisphaerae bacterium]|nr:PEP-CTERM sorting domain-containing protein [Phycisphaerae bacterium]
MKKKTISTVVVLLLITASVSVGSVILYTPPAGDAAFYWNSKYGYDSYTTGNTEMGIYLDMGGTYGNDRTISIFEIPIAALTGQTIESATLEVNALSFGTNYYYGSAAIGWLNTGTMTLTGDIVADGLGAPAKSVPGGFTIYNSDYTYTLGLKQFDVSTCVQADLDAGRTYSTFVMSGSRETWGSIYTAESGSGPRIIAAVVPEPATVALLTLGALSLIKRNKK